MLVHEIIFTPPCLSASIRRFRSPVRPHPIHCGAPLLVCLDSERKLGDVVLLLTGPVD
jgi:hypothetical protein